MSSHMPRSRILVIFIILFSLTLLWSKRHEWPLLPRPSHVSVQSSSESTDTEAFSDTPLPNQPVTAHNPNRRPISAGFSDLPTIYNQKEEIPSFCADRFGLPFLQHLNESASSYCTAESSAAATCFQVTTTEHRKDSLCVGGPVTFDPADGRFTLPCDVQHGKSFDSLGRYWYQTGPEIVFRQFVNVQNITSDKNNAKSPSESDLLLLIKREGASNLWHSLMEVFAATLTLDTISMARDPRTSASILSDEEDLSRVRIVVLDDKEEGPFWDVYKRFSPLPMVRLSELSPEMASGNRIIVPLAGGANPFWQGDWDVLSCRESALLDVFVQRIFKWHDMPVKRRSEPSGPIRLTYIDRRGQRKLFDQDAHIDALRKKFPLPHVQIEVVDFAQLSFQEQIEKARETDILVGVHGAGLTHAMFMDRETAVVEIMPEKLDHKGFRNMAKLRNIEYYGMHGKEATASEDWHTGDVNISVEDYVHLIDAAVAGVSNSGSRNYDIQ